MCLTLYIRFASNVSAVLLVSWQRCLKSMKSCLVVLFARMLSEFVLFSRCRTFLNSDFLPPSPPLTSTCIGMGVSKWLYGLPSRGDCSLLSLFRWSTAGRATTLLTPAAYAVVFLKLYLTCEMSRKFFTCWPTLALLASFSSPS